MEQITKIRKQFTQSSIKQDNLILKLDDFFKKKTNKSKLW